MIFLMRFVTNLFMKKEGKVMFFHGARELSHEGTTESRTFFNKLLHLNEEKIGL